MKKKKKTKFQFNKSSTEGTHLPLHPASINERLSRGVGRDVRVKKALELGKIWAIPYNE